MSSVVKPLQDKGPYQCFLTGLDTSYAALTEESLPKTINYTGNMRIIMFIKTRPSFTTLNQKAFECNKKLHNVVVSNIFNTL